MTNTLWIIAWTWTSIFYASRQFLVAKGDFQCHNGQPSPYLIPNPCLHCGIQFTGQCIACNPGAALNGDPYTYGSLSEKSDTGADCVFCAPDGYSPGGTQVHCTPVTVVPNCATYDEITGACTSCLGGGLLNNGVCCYGNCATCNNADPAAATCASCTSDRVLTSGTCCIWDLMPPPTYDSGAVFVLANYFTCSGPEFSFDLAGVLGYDCTYTGPSDTTQGTRFLPVSVSTFDVVDPDDTGAAVGYSFGCSCIETVVSTALVITNPSAGDPYVTFTFTFSIQIGATFFTSPVTDGAFTIVPTSVPRANNVALNIPRFCQGALSNIVGLDFAQTSFPRFDATCGKSVVNFIIVLPSPSIGYLQIASGGQPIVPIHSVPHEVTNTLGPVQFVLSQTAPASSYVLNIPYQAMTVGSIIDKIGYINLTIGPPIVPDANSSSTRFLACIGVSPTFFLAVYNLDSACDNAPISVTVISIPSALRGQLQCLVNSTTTVYTVITTVPYTILDYTAPISCRVVVPPLSDISSFLPYNDTILYQANVGGTNSLTASVIVQVLSGQSYPLPAKHLSFTTDQCTPAPQALTFTVPVASTDVPYTQCAQPLAFQFTSIPPAAQGVLYYSTTGTGGTFLPVNSTTPPLVYSTTFRLTPIPFNSIQRNMTWVFVYITQEAPPFSVTNTINIVVTTADAQPPIPLSRNYTVFAGVDNLFQLTSNPRGCPNIPALSTWPITVLPALGTLLQSTTLLPLPLIPLPVPPFTVLPTDPNFMGLIVYNLSSFDTQSTIPLPLPSPAILGTQSFRFYTIAAGRLSQTTATATLNILNVLSAIGQTITVDENQANIEFVLYASILSLVSVPPALLPLTEMVITSLPSLGQILYGTDTKSVLTIADLPLVIPFDYVTLGHTPFGYLEYQLPVNVSGTASFQFYFAIPNFFGSPLATETFVINEVNIAPWWQITVLSPPINATLNPIQDGIILPIGTMLVIQAIIQDVEPSIYPMTLDITVTSPFLVSYLTLAGEFNNHELIVSGGNNTAAITVIAQKGLLNGFMNNIKIHFYGAGILTFFVNDNDPHDPMSATFNIPLFVGF